MATSHLVGFASFCNLLYSYVAGEHAVFQSFRYNEFYFFNRIDATRHTGRLGRLVNDSSCPNCRVKKLTINGMPRLAIFAAKDIRIGEELTYSYDSGEEWWRKVG